MLSCLLEPTEGDAQVMGHPIRREPMAVRAATGKAFATVGRAMPTAWAMEGLQNIVVRGQGLGSTLLPAGVLLACTVAFFGLAV
jgi:hypothetical protein